MADDAWILTFACEDRIGIVAAVAGALAQAGGFILDRQQYADLDTGRFFRRVVFSGDDLRGALEPVAARFAFDWSLTRADDRPRVLIAGSTTSPCLSDLLHRWSTGAAQWCAHRRVPLRASV